MGRPTESTDQNIDSGLTTGESAQDQMQVTVVWLGQYMGPLTVRPGTNSNALIVFVEEPILYGGIPCSIQTKGWRMENFVLPQQSYWTDLADLQGEALTSLSDGVGKGGVRGEEVVGTEIGM